MHQGCGFDPWSGHTQESINECMNKWNKELVFLSLKSINKIKNKKERIRPQPWPGQAQVM